MASDRDVRLFLREQFAVVAVELRRVTAEVVHLIARNFEHVRIHIRERDDFAAAGGHCFLEDIFAPPARADERGAELRGLCGADEWRACKCCKRGGL